MVWQPLQRVTPRAQVATLTLEEVRQYCRFTSEGSHDDALLTAIGEAIPLTFEGRLNRAVYQQQRAYTALLAESERVAGVDLEPHDRGSLAVTLNGVPVAGVRSLGGPVIIDPPVTGIENAELRFQYQAGWTAAELPPDLKDAMLYEAMKRFVRRNEGLNQSQTVPMPKAPSVDAFIVWPDPVRRSLRSINLAEN